MTPARELRWPGACSATRALPTLIDLLPDPRAVLVLRALAAAYVEYHHRLSPSRQDARAGDPERPGTNPPPPGAASE